MCDDEEHYGETVSFEQCRLCALGRNPLKDGRACHTPAAVIHGMAQNGIQRSDAGLSATTLLGACPRKVIIERDYDFGEHGKDYWQRWRGTTFHTLMEEVGEEPEGILQERRLFRDVEVDGETITISGKFDYFDIERQLIQDYKTCNDVNVSPINEGKPKPDHTKQVNVYAFLLADGRDGEGNIYQYEVTRGGIVYMSMKETRKVSVPIWPLEKTQAFIEKQLRPILESKRTGVLPKPVSQFFQSGNYFPCHWCSVRSICSELYEKGE